MGDVLRPGYALRTGSSLDRALLVKFMQRTYEEIHPQRDFHHLAHTVDQYLSNQTQLWWVEPIPNQSVAARVPVAGATLPQTHKLSPIGCLWMGQGTDQVQGDRHAYIFLLYVAPEHRRCGLGTALMHHAERWATQRGDRQISLQVFCHNQPALALYEKLGYHAQAILMAKPLVNP
ncbi:MAG: GNAT family N-acetyltransferase [Synechococcales bacterium]|nr:GNAT family N-acetyltransferase [Synechococcales bacterium]